MADIFKNYTPRLESPLSQIELVPVGYTSSGYVFNQTPRAINCSSEGTLKVTMGSAVTASIYVTAGLNPYRIQAIHSGSSAGTIVGMY